tara:strand:- start:15219 stop:15365 length:147 start_codon:yes stop_codon:yes gene_type:complete
MALRLGIGSKSLLRAETANINRQWQVHEHSMRCSGNFLLAAEDETVKN